MRQACEAQPVWAPPAEGPGLAPGDWACAEGAGASEDAKLLEEWGRSPVGAVVGQGRIALMEDASTGKAAAGELDKKVVPPTRATAVPG